MRDASLRTASTDPQFREDQLFTEIRAAREEYLRISAEFDTIAGPIRLPSHGALPSVGTQALANLGKQRVVAFEKYRKTLADMSGLLLGRELNNPNGAGTTEHLTPRERQVLALIAGGKKTKALAFELGIAFKTAACHRTRIMSKLYAQNAADLTRAAIRMGLIEP
jgi:DNA-binding NarL/FixJ family response regulator